MKSSLPLIYARYCDVDEPRPRYGGSVFTLHRQVSNIQAVKGGRRGAIQYKGRTVAVYQRSGSSWDTDQSVLGPIKLTSLH